MSDKITDDKNDERDNNSVDNDSIDNSPNEERRNDDGNRQHDQPIRLAEPDIGLGDGGSSVSRYIERSQENTEPRYVKKEDGPISFKHFLNCGPKQNNNNNKAFPDLYACSQPDLETLNVSSPDEPTHKSDPTSTLPDFVQDHLALEQQYFNKNHSSQMSNGDHSRRSFVSNGVKCYLNENEYPNQKRWVNKTPTDLRKVSVSIQYPCSNPPRDNNSSPESNTSAYGSKRTRNITPLDLPPISDFYSQRNRGWLPSSCDLTQMDEPCKIRSPNTSEQLQSGLPDFLSDAHIHGSASSRSRDFRIQLPSEQRMNDAACDNRIEMLQMENQELLRQVENLRDQINKQNLRAQQAELALTVSRAVKQRESSSKPTVQKLMSLMMGAGNDMFSASDSSFPSTSDGRTESELIKARCSFIAEELKNKIKKSDKLYRELSLNMSELHTLCKNLELICQCDAGDANNKEKEDVDENSDDD